MAGHFLIGVHIALRAGQHLQPRPRTTTEPSCINARRAHRPHHRRKALPSSLHVYFKDGRAKVRTRTLPRQTISTSGKPLQNTPRCRPRLKDPAEEIELQLSWLEKECKSSTTFRRFHGHSCRIASTPPPLTQKATRVDERRDVISAHGRGGLSAEKRLATWGQLLNRCIPLQLRRCVLDAADSGLRRQEATGAASCRRSNAATRPTRSPRPMTALRRASGFTVVSRCCLLRSRLPHHHIDQRRHQSSVARNQVSLNSHFRRRVRIVRAAP